MPAPVAAWTGQLARAQPACTADELALVPGACASADGAGRGKEEVERRARSATPASC